MVWWPDKKHGHQCAELQTAQRGTQMMCLILLLSQSLSKCSFSYSFPSTIKVKGCRSKFRFFCFHKLETIKGRWVGISFWKNVDFSFPYFCRWQFKPFMFQKPNEHSFDRIQCFFYLPTNWHHDFDVRSVCKACPLCQNHFKWLWERLLLSTTWALCQ